MIGHEELKRDIRRYFAARKMECEGDDIVIDLELIENERVEGVRRLPAKFGVTQKGAPLSAPPLRRTTLGVSV